MRRWDIKMLKYSFVIPTYRNKKLLRNSLEALNNQEGFSYGEYEAVIIDDGSDDDTWSYIEGVNRNYSLRFIFLERNSNSCRSKARNIGWRIASGEIIIFIDADIIVKSTHLKELDRCFGMRKDLVVIGTRINLPEGAPCENIHDGSLFSNYKFSGDRAELFEERHYAFESLSYNMSLQRFPWLMVFTCNLALPKTMLVEIQGFDENFKKWGAEDLDVGYRLFQKGKKIIVNPRLDVYHQYHPSSNDGSKDSSESTAYFMEKHGGPFEDVPKGSEFSIFHIQLSQRGRVFREDSLVSKFRIRHRSQNVEVYDFKSKDMLEEFKQYILKVGDKDSREIIINDHTEDTDLDIWTQLLEGCKCIPEYYPVSKRITPKAVFSTIGQLLEDVYAKRST